jgi:hypothetical protein
MFADRLGHHLGLRLEMLEDARLNVGGLPPHTHTRTRVTELMQRAECAHIGTERRRAREPVCAVYVHRPVWWWVLCCPRHHPVGARRVLRTTAALTRIHGLADYALAAPVHEIETLAAYRPQLTRDVVPDGLGQLTDSLLARLLVDVTLTPVLDGLGGHADAAVHLAAVGIDHLSDGEMG